MNKIAIIGSGTFAKILAERAKELEIETHCFSFNKDDVAVSYVDYFYEINIFDIDHIVAVCRAVNVNGVIATTELTIYPAALIAAQMDLVGNRVEVAREITNKFLNREKTRQVQGLRQPIYWKCTKEDIPELEIYPLIVKPLAAGGKRGIMVVNTQAELEREVGRSAKYSRIEGVLVEQYLQGGQEYSVESLSYKGKPYIVQVTKKITSGPPRCLELGHDQPADLTSKMREKVDKVVSDILLALKIENGPCHTEIKIIDGEIYLIEVNARPGGDHITYPLTELSTGYPIVTGIILASLGRLEGHEPWRHILGKRYAGVRFITEQNPALYQLFDNCEKYSWLYEKHKVSETPSKLMFNDEYNLNYFIYYSDKKVICEGITDE